MRDRALELQRGQEFGVDVDVVIFFLNQNLLKSNSLKSNSLKSNSFF